MKTLQNCSQLMQLTQNGNKKAYQELLEICQHVLHHFYNNQAHNSTDKDNIIQKILFQLGFLALPDINYMTIIRTKKNIKKIMILI